MAASGPAMRVHLGRMQIGLAVAKGAPHPDISTVAKLAAALKAAQLVVYTDPANGSLQARMIDALLNRPEFAGIHKQVSSKGNGIAALARGDGDMALQLVCEILDRPETELVGALPAALNASIDADAAVLSGAPHPKEAAAYLKHITEPDAVQSGHRKDWYGNEDQGICSGDRAAVAAGPGPGRGPGGGENGSSRRIPIMRCGCPIRSWPN